MNTHCPALFTVNEAQVSGRGLCAMRRYRENCLLLETDEAQLAAGRSSVRFLPSSGLRMKVLSMCCVWTRCRSGESCDRNV